MWNGYERNEWAKNGRKPQTLISWINKLMGQLVPSVKNL